MINDVIQYAAFKIYDRKNNVLAKTSCAPGHISNYDEATVLPWEISPAFFRVDVLNKYRADTENCELGNNYLKYRGDWDLKSFGFSVGGLVHTYIRYLQPLPLEEQLHWQSFNVWPSIEDAFPFRRWSPLRPGATEPDLF